MSRITSGRKAPVRATEQAGGPWSPDMLQGSATTALMTREVERLGVQAQAS
jgi:hypothetical protein